MKVLATAFAVGLLIGWGVNGLRLNAEISAINTAHAQAKTQAIEQVRQIEQAWQSKVNEVSQSAQESIEMAQRDAVSADDAADRMRNELDRIKRQSSRCASTAERSQATPSTTDVLTDLLSEVEAAGRELAAEADARRVAGLTCERSWPVNPG